MVPRKACIRLMAPSVMGPMIPSSGPELKPSRFMCAWRSVASVTVSPVYELYDPFRVELLRF